MDGLIPVRPSRQVGEGELVNKTHQGNMGLDQLFAKCSETRLPLNQ